MSWYWEAIRSILFVFVLTRTFELENKKIVLNQSLLLNNDVHDFENEAGIKVFYNMPPLDERKRNAIIGDFLTKLGIKNDTRKNNSTKIFGLFRR